MACVCNCMYLSRSFPKIFRNISVRHLCSKTESSGESSQSSDPKENVQKPVDDGSPLVSEAVDIETLSQKKTDRDEENVFTKKDQKQTVTHTRLHSALSDFKVINSTPSQHKIFHLDLAKPQWRLGKPQDPIKKKLKENKRVQYGNDMVSAIKAVASSFGSDVKETEQVLVEKIVSLKSEEENASLETSRAESRIGPDENENMMSTVQAIASTVDEQRSVESELTKKLFSIVKIQESNKDGLAKDYMLDLFEGMKVEHEPARHPYLKKSKSNLRSGQNEREKVKVEVFNAHPLDVFTVENKDASQSSPHLLLWDKLQNEELKSLVNYAPTNAFEEWIQLTEQGKLWTFPIDNEAGTPEEEKVGFHEHVFLDHLLEGFPKEDSIQRFMELVIIGLSKNPYVSVQRKADHVAWFRDYFIQKEDILKQYEVETVHIE